MFPETSTLNKIGKADIASKNFDDVGKAGLDEIIRPIIHQQYVSRSLSFEGVEFNSEAVLIGIVEEA